MRREPLLDLVRQRVSGRLRLGLLRPGDRIQSVRVAAQELDVDPRVVLAAYQRLAAEGMLELRPRSGVYVANPSAMPMQGAGLVSDRETQWLIDQLAHALEAGMPAPSFPEHARRALETRRLRAVVVDRNDDQLWSTVDELTRDYGFETSAIDLDGFHRGDGLPLSLRRADLVVTASPSSAVTALAKRAQLPLIAVSMCPDLFAEVRRLLRHDAVYFVVSDARFAKKSRAFLAPARGPSRFRALVYGQDDLRVIPPSAPVYLTRLTRDRMQRAHDSSAGANGDDPRLLERVLPEARVFSAESARELISFVVRANLAPPPASSPGTASPSLAAAYALASAPPSGSPSRPAVAAPSRQRARRAPPRSLGR